MQKFIVLTLDKLVHTIEIELPEPENQSMEARIRRGAGTIVENGFWDEEGSFYTSQAVFKITPIRD